MCNLGEYCCKCDNHCKDCSNTFIMREGIPDADEYEYAAHCNKTDLMPTRCDHIVNHAKEATFFDQLGIVICSFLLAGTCASLAHPTRAARRLGVRS